MLSPRQSRIFRWSWVHPEGWYLLLPNNTAPSGLVSHLPFLPLIPTLCYPLNLTRNSPGELFPPALHQWGVASLEGTGGRARTPWLLALRRDGTASLQGGKEEAGLQYNWDSIPLSHTSTHAVRANPKEKPHTLYYTVVTCSGKPPTPLRAASRSQNPCSSAKPPYKSVFTSTLVLHLQESSEKKPPHTQCLCLPSLPLRFFTSQLCLGVTVLSSSRHCLVRKTLFSAGKAQACRIESFNTMSGFQDTSHPNTRQRRHQSMHRLCELPRCLCLTFELGAIKVSKAKTTVKQQSLWSEKLPTWTLLPCVTAER